MKKSVGVKMGYTFTCFNALFNIQSDIFHWILLTKGLFSKQPDCYPNMIFSVGLYILNEIAYEWSCLQQFALDCLYL